MAKYDQPGHISKMPGLSMDARLMSAPGSDPSRTVPWDAPIDQSAVTGDPSGIAIPLDQAGGHKTGSSIVAGQNDGGLPGAGENADFTTTGAGDGHNFTDARRYPWQQRPGG